MSLMDYSFIHTLFIPIDSRYTYIVNTEQRVVQCQQVYALKLDYTIFPKYRVDFNRYTIQYTTSVILYIVI